MSPAIHCAQCDYDLKGLEFDGLCPECAHPVLETLAAVRTGSPWQRRPSVLAWLQTGVEMCRHPRQFWAQVELEFPRTWNLLVVNALMSSFLIGAALTALMNTSMGAAGSVGGLIGGLFLGAPIFLVLFLLTNLQMAIVRALAPEAGRLAVRGAVAHASFLWISAAPIALLAPRAPTITVLFVIPAAGIVWLGAIGARRLRYAPEPVA